MKTLFKVLASTAVIFATSIWALDLSAKGNAPEKDKHASSGTQHEEHDHGSASGPKAEAEPNDHQKHEDHDGHGHEEEEEGGGSVGPGKGVLEASPEEGIKLSSEAMKNFEIRTQKLSGSGPWNIPASARLLTGEEANIYRLRDGRFKRIDFALVKRSGDQIVIASHELKSQDEVVVNGVGFLRMAELTAFGGAPEGHGH